MNPQSKINAADILNQYSEEQLKTIFEEFGEVENAKRLSKTIITQRERSKFIKSSDLVNATKSLIPKGMENKYLAKVFQALRIEVNKELESLQSMLLQCTEFIKPGGRLVVITYHSLEDRIVKNFVKSGNFAGKIEKDFYGNPLVPFKAISNKVIVPADEEILKNSRARSAKLRIAEKI
jgi:16S rRNA (cytosine1402-N4)-methyltransferase